MSSCVMRLSPLACFRPPSMGICTPFTPLLVLRQAFGSSTSHSSGGGVSSTVTLHWGEMDAFQHLNNVQYFRHFETARIGKATAT